jgi:hypothetical protein
LVKILERYKIRPLAAHPGKDLLAPGDTLCIATLRYVHQRRGSDWLSLLCAMLHEGRYRPIAREHIFAVDKVIELAGAGLDARRMGQAMRSIVPKHASLEAREISRKQGIPRAIAHARLLIARYKAGAQALDNP